MFSLISAPKTEPKRTSVKMTPPSPAKEEKKPPAGGRAVRNLPVIIYMGFLELKKVMGFYFLSPDRSFLHLFHACALYILSCVLISLMNKVKF